MPTSESTQPNATTGKSRFDKSDTKLVDKLTRRLSWSFSRGHRQRWMTAIDELSMMLAAGLPILQSLETIADQHRGGFRTGVLAVRESVASGQSLAAALKQSGQFDDAQIAMVTVGENAGNLDVVLAELAEFGRRQSMVRDRVATAMVYPAFLVCFGTAAAIFLMTWVLPPLLDNLQETVDKLPWPTRVAKTISDTLIDHYAALIAAAGTVFAAAAAWFSSTTGRLWWHRSMLRLPILGPMSVKQCVSRIAGVIATLSRSGVELTRAFELAETSIDNTVFQSALRQSTKQISAGVDVAEALDQTGVFPPLAVRVFSIGQESGRLDPMLTRLADDYDRSVATSSARLTALVEPVLILVLAVMVGFLLLATILPILEAGNVAGA